MLNIADSAGNTSTIYGQDVIANILGGQPVITITQ